MQIDPRLLAPLLRFPRAIQPQNENGGDLDVASSVWSAEEREKDRKRIDFVRRRFAIRQEQEVGCWRGGEEMREGLLTGMH